ncbi:MAG: hypothetical protein AB1420_07550 [Bacillota bacterium]
MAKGRLAANEYEFKIDFGKFSPRPPADTQGNTGSTGNLLQDLSRAFVPSLDPNLITGDSSSGTGGGTQVIVSPIQGAIGPTGVKMVEMGDLQYALAAGGNLRYYIRVVPVVASYDGNYKGYPSDTRSVLYGEPGERFQPYFPDYDRLTVEYVAPAVKIKSYQPIQFEDPNWVYRFVVYKDPGDKPIFPGVSNLTWRDLYHVGQKLDLTPQPEKKGFWDHVGDFFSSVFNFITGVLNWVSNAWDSIKATCINIVAAAIPFCGDTCKAGLNMALNAGLAALGIPPSIPNFEQLLEGGVEYLAATIAEEAGVPADVVKAGLDKLLDEAEGAGSKANNGQPPLGLDFIKLDPDFQYRNATLNIVLTNTAGKPTTPGTLIIIDADQWAKDVFRPVNNIPVPSLKPGQTLRIPVYLVENNDYFNLSITNPLPLPMNEWCDRYWGETTTFKVWYSAAITDAAVQEFLKSYEQWGWGSAWEYVDMVNKGSSKNKDEVTFTTRQTHNF